MNILTRRGQATIENAIVLTAVVIALLGVAQYLRRASEGHEKQAADQVGEQWSTADSKYSIDVENKGVRQEDLTTKGESTSEIKTAEVQDRNATSYEVGGDVKAGLTK